MEWESVLKEAAYLPAILTVTITHREEVAMFETHYVWWCYVCILVRFIGIVSSDSTFGRKWKLSDNVTYLILIWLRFIFSGCCRVVLRLAGACLISWLFSLLWVWFLVLARWKLLCVSSSHSLHLLKLLLHSKLLRIRLYTLQTLTLTKTTNI